MVDVIWLFRLLARPEHNTVTMAFERRWLWAAALSLLALIAVFVQVRAPKRVARPEEARSLPAPQLGSGGACEAERLPRGMETFPPSTTLSESDRRQEVARRNVIACVLQQQYPAAAVNFGYMQQGQAAFDVVFPDRSYSTVSVSTFSVLPPQGSETTHLVLVWPTSKSPAFPPLTIARADAEGKISYYSTFAIEDERARLDLEQLPKWGEALENTVAMEYEATYEREGSEARVTWTATFDTAAAELVSRWPVRATITRGGRTVFNGEISRTGMMNGHLELNAAGKALRIPCVRQSGEFCVVSSAEVLDALQ